MKASRRVFLGLTAAALTLAGGGESKGTDEKGSGENRFLNLYDNMVANAGDAISHWGFSAYITYHGKRILFDSGNCPDILAHNAKAFGVNLTKVGIAVLSHNHPDHIYGFDYLLKVNRKFTFYVPNDFFLGGALPVNVLPARFEKRFADSDKKNASGFQYRHANTHIVAGHTEIAEGMHLIATLSPSTGRFNKYPPFENEPQLNGLPELSLALSRSDGQITLISGCSHSKIEEIVKETKKHLGKNVALVIGGFHHAPYSNEYVAATAKTLKDELGVQQVAASHCTGEKAVGIFKEIYRENFLDSGLGARLSL